MKLAWVQREKNAIKVTQLFFLCPQGFFVKFSKAKDLWPTYHPYHVDSQINRCFTNPGIKLTKKCLMCWDAWIFFSYCVVLQLWVFLCVTKEKAILTCTFHCLASLARPELRAMQWIHTACKRKYWPEKMQNSKTTLKQQPAVAKHSPLLCHFFPQRN